MNSNVGSVKSDDRLWSSKAAAWGFCLLTPKRGRGHSQCSTPTSTVNKTLSQRSVCKRYSKVLLMKTFRIYVMLQILLHGLRLPNMFQEQLMPGIDCELFSSFLLLLPSFQISSQHSFLFLLLPSFLSHLQKTQSRLFSKRFTRPHCPNLSTVTGRHPAY